MNLQCKRRLPWALVSSPKQQCSNHGGQQEAHERNHYRTSRQLTPAHAVGTRGTLPQQQELRDGYFLFHLSSEFANRVLQLVVNHGGAAVPTTTRLDLDATTIEYLTTHSLRSVANPIIVCAGFVSSTIDSSTTTLCAAPMRRVSTRALSRSAQITWKNHSDTSFHTRARVLKQCQEGDFCPTKPGRRYKSYFFTNYFLR